MKEDFEGFIKIIEITSSRHSQFDEVAGKISAIRRHWATLSKKTEKYIFGKILEIVGYQSSVSCVRKSQ